MNESVVALKDLALFLTSGVFAFVLTSVVALKDLALQVTSPPYINIWRERFRLRSLSPIFNPKPTTQVTA